MNNAAIFIVNALMFSCVTMIGSFIGVKPWQTLIIAVLTLAWTQLRKQYPAK